MPVSTPAPPSPLRPEVSRKKSLRVCPMGFDSRDMESVKHAIAAVGHEMISLAALADVIVVPDAQKASLRELLGANRTFQGSALAWDDYLLRFHGSDFLGSLTGEDRAEPIRPVFQHSAGRVEVLGVGLSVEPAGLESAGTMVPGGIRLCLDQPTVEILAHLAACVAGDLPGMLVGISGATKSTGVLRLAQELGKPVHRVQLDGAGASAIQALVGRHVPNPDPGGNPFRWVDGALPEAMRSGAWVLMDEIFLAGTEFLERANSVLEPGGTLVVHENLGETIVREPGFRIFATTNPPTYVGRSVPSQALEDRFVCLQVNAPDEGAIRSQFDWLLTGKHPLVRWEGRLYQGVDEMPLFGDLESIRDEMAGLPGAHHALAVATGSTGGTRALGRTRKHPYNFSRRALDMALRMVRFGLAQGHSPKMALKSAITKIYFNRIDPEDRPMVADLFKGHGL